MSTREKVARWLAAYTGGPAWDTQPNGLRMRYEDAADDLLRVIYAGGAQDAVDVGGDAA